MTKKTIKRLALILFALTILVLIVFRIYQIQAEKHDFAEAEKRIDGVAQQIEQTIGKPDSNVIDKHCGRANIKNDEGPLVCNIIRTVSYHSLGLEEANILMSRISNLFTGELRIGSGSTQTTHFTSIDDNDQQTLFQQLSTKIGKLSCSLIYRYPGDDRLSTEYSHKKLFIDISCGGKATKQIYSLKAD